MNVPELFYRMAELTEETTLAKLVKGSQVKVGGTWLTVGESSGKRLVLLDDEQNDIEYSDLNVISEVRWGHEIRSMGTKPKPDHQIETNHEAPTHSVGISDAALAAVSGKK